MPLAYCAAVGAYCWHQANANVAGMNTLIQTCHEADARESRWGDAVAVTITAMCTSLGGGVYSCRLGEENGTLVTRPLDRDKKQSKLESYPPPEYTGQSVKLKSDLSKPNFFVVLEL